MDPLSNVLSLLKPRNYMSAGLEAGGDWSIQFPDQQDGIKCCAVVAGRCWLSVAGVADPVFVEAGDSFLLPSGRPFRLASDPASVPAGGGEVFSSPCKPGIVSFNGGGDFLLVSSRFGLEGNHAEILLRMLPPIIHIRDRSDEPALRWPVERMMEELRDPRPGGALVVEHLAHMMLVDALRLHLAQGSAGGVGWLFALGDRQLSLAINSMHDEPAHRWTLQELATRAAMSRSTFALKFKEKVGTSPMDYLASWRMLLAADRLKTSSDSLSTVARSIGYDSDTSFSMAFKKIMGCSPRAYGRRQDRVSGSMGVARAA
ncbi:AraC family transcriptional regulator [Mesorhizobium sp.]|jgi:AraC-like DNA-binding protein|uniref:AraC family transcriptional regulator n=1 Tax=Mesorhizobium sp. TaxID=1871066 RepID=UPI003562D7A8